MNVNISFTELEWKFGLLNLYSNRYLFVRNMRVNPIGANKAIIGCKGRKKAVKYEVFII